MTFMTDWRGAVIIVALGLVSTLLVVLGLKYRVRATLLVPMILSSIAIVCFGSILFLANRKAVTHYQNLPDLNALVGDSIGATDLDKTQESEDGNDERKQSP